MSRIVKITYIVLIGLVLILPFFITERIFFIPESHSESLAILMVLGLIWSVHYLDVMRRKKETSDLKIKLDNSINKVLESHKYIGNLNRRLSFLKEITSNPLEISSDRKAVFEELLSIAVESVAKVDWGMFRFIDVKSGNTVRENFYTAKNYLLLKASIGNKEMLQMLKEGIKFRIINDFCVVNTCDSKEKIQCFLILPKFVCDKEDQYPILQSITDQAQIFYKYLR